MTIPIGTPCFVIRTGPGNKHLIGRVIEVIGPALPLPEYDGMAMHRIDAPWLRSERPGVHCYAAPSSLLPITPPDPAIERRRPEPVKA